MHAVVSRAIAIALIVLIGAAAPAVAQTGEDATPAATPSPVGPVFAIFQRDPGEESYFSVELKPGESKEFTAVVGTFDSIPVSLRAFATNALSAPNGGFAAGTEEDELVAPATWISFPAQGFDLGSNDRIEIPFTVTVPPGTAPGQYMAALVAQTDGPLAVPGTTLIDLISRNAIAVEIIVPGERTVSFALGEPVFVFEAPWTRLVIPIDNTGNYLVRPEGSFTIATADGVIVTEAPIAMGSVYAGTSTVVDILLPEQFAPGDYLVQGTLTDPESGFSVSLDETTVTLAEAEEAAPPPEFVVDPVSITAVGDPVQFAEIAITIQNNGRVVPTGKVVLTVSKDGEMVEEYVLAQNQAMPSGASTITERYIPSTGWESGTYTFAITVLSVDASGTETVLTSAEVADTIVVP